MERLVFTTTVIGSYMVCLVFNATVIGLSIVRLRKYVTIISAFRVRLHWVCVLPAKFDDDVYVSSSMCL